jgi:Cysteine-rich secretory protein family
MRPKDYPDFMQEALVILLALLLLTPFASAQKAIPSAEQTLLQLANRRRAEHRLPPLSFDPALTRAAHAHASLIIRYPAPALHQYPGEPDLLSRAAQAGAHFSTVSENVAGNGNTVAEIESAWMNSPVHRANILDPHVNVVGIAVIEVRGLLYSVEDFAQNVPVLGRNDVESRVQQLLLEQGIHPAASAENREFARRHCETPTSPIGSAILSMQWDGADLTQLPNSLLQQVPQARQHTAAVGACPSKRASEAFTTYRIAVLLF